MGIVSSRVSAHVRKISLSLLAALLLGINGVEVGRADEKRKKGVQASSTPAEKATRVQAPHKVATQKLMRNPWEQTHKAPEVASATPRKGN